MFSKKRTGQNSKLDDLLRAGASGRKPAVDIDKAVSSTTHRLVKEVIAFKKQTAVHDTTEQYRNSGFSILEPEKEPLAKSRLAGLVSSNKLPRTVLIRTTHSRNVVKKHLKSSKRKNRQKKKGQTK
ncbi:hypothetical protein TELCIR_06187 [Teladorsagia circumcincta]|uniref:Uncharacterized protein n=1 Tax=Teladorsagia circumcincta TaxID=45464 RepID=A0A2G9UNS1_TELCI|nr:hypothetical protein TELCIR_06187 [Teladorsagia circumcincta]